MSFLSIGNQLVPKLDNTFRRFARNSGKDVDFHNIHTPGNQVKLRYFIQCRIIR